MQTISIGYGQANFDTASVRVSSYLVTPPFGREWITKVGKKQGTTSYFVATDDEQTGGKMMQDNAMIEDGHVLCLQSSHTSHGRSHMDGAVFLHLREQAPAYAITAKLPISRHSKLGGSFVVFQGRGDLMSLDDLNVLGIKPNRGWIEGFMQDDEIDHCYDIVELAGEIAPKPRAELVTNLSGEQKSIVIAAPKRRMRIR